MNITVGAYKTTNWTFYPSTNVINVYDFFDNLNLNTLNVAAIQRNGASIPILAPGFSFVHDISLNKPPSVPTASAPTSGGSKTPGTHSYNWSYIIGSTETLISDKSNVITINASNATVSVTVPFGPAGTLSRNVYGTLAGDVSIYLIGSLPDNSTGTFIDTFVDNAANSLAPTSTNSYNITYNASLGSLQVGDNPFIVVNVPDPTIDLNTNSINTINQTPDWSHTIDQYEPIDYSNQFNVTNRDSLDLRNYKNYTLDFTGACSSTHTVTITLWKPMKSTAVDQDPSDNLWRNVTLDLTNNVYSSFVINASNPVLSQSVYISDLVINRLQIKSVFSTTDPSVGNNSFTVSLTSN
jgi:hypothetical protein